MKTVTFSRAIWLIWILISSLGLLTLALLPEAQAATIYWTNSAGGNWSNPLNWNPNQVPGQLNDPSNADDAMIAIPSSPNYPVTFDEGNSTNFWGIHSLTIGSANSMNFDNGATIRAAQVSITFGGLLSCGPSSAISAPLIVSSGGQLNAFGDPQFDGPVTFGGYGTISGGSFNQGLTVESGAFLILQSDVGWGGVCNVAGTLNLLGELYVWGPVTNTGVITVANNSGNSGSLNGFIGLYNDGTTNLQGSLINAPGGIIKLNEGTIEGEDGQEIFINRGALISNDALVNVPFFDNSAGVVTNLSGAFSLGQFTNAFLGSFYAAGGSLFWLSGGSASAPLAPGPALKFYGAGAYQFLGGFLLLRNNVNTNLALISGILELGSFFQGGAITNLTFDSMCLTNSTLPVTGTLTVRSSSAQVFGGLTIASGGVLNANNGDYHGSLVIASNGTMTMLSGDIANDARLTVNGTLNISSGIVYLDGLLTNFNVVNLSGGVLIDNDGVNYFGGIVNQGRGTINISTNGSVRPDGGDEQFLVNNGAIVVNAGTNPAVVSIPNITNSGIVSVQQGTLQLSRVSLLPSSRMNVLLTSPSNYGKISISSATALGGGFGATITSNYWPHSGLFFEPLTYNSYSGHFTSTDLPPAIPLQVLYNPTNLTLLVTTSTPAFTTLASSGGKVILGGIHGTPENTYWVWANTNLTQPLTNGTAIGTNQFDENGNFSFTNVINYTNSREFFLLESR